jgi:quercetin dioxygenase-like cupin family protein
LANIGTNLVRAMVVVNETAGDDTTSEQAARFDGTPELTNKWFRSYRRTLQPGETSPAHSHGAPVAIIQATDGKGLAEGPLKFELNETGQWAFFDAGVPHTVRNLGEAPLELLEIEVRLPR